jgi:hypothetical protein
MLASAGMRGDSLSKSSSKIPRQLSVRSRTLTLAQLHQSVPRAHQLLRFITENRVAMCPPDNNPPNPVPPEPD